MEHERKSSPTFLTSERRERPRATRCAKQFRVISLRIPWSIDRSQCLCGFYNGNFFYREKLPVRFPAQGIERLLSAEDGMQTCC